MNTVYQVAIFAFKEYLIEASSPEEAEEIIKQRTNLGDLCLDACSVVDVLEDPDELADKAKRLGEVLIP